MRCVWWSLVSCSGLWCCSWAFVWGQETPVTAPTLATPSITPVDGPVAPERVLETMRVESGLRLDLIAAEPFTASPCALAWDETGRLFVAENRGYPTGPGPDQPAVGIIAHLEDKDGDGRIDTRTEFATGLSFPNGLLPWRGGWIVTCAPEVLYLKDSNGDGKADVRQVLLTGFDTQGSTQLRVSHPTLGADGWIYLTSGLTGGKVISPLRPSQPPVEVRRTDLRFRPETGEVEPADGGAQFGQAFDDFGRRFICYNRVQVQHVVLDSHYLRRHPQLPFAETVENCPAEMQAEPLRGHGSAARIYPISNNVTTADSHAGTFTAACGLMHYSSTGLPSEYQNTAWSCDPTGNLVHVDRLLPRGATFSAVRMHPEREVVAGADNWFRPVFLATGPEGAIYICDMYRKTIEHPDYLPVEIRKHTDFESGKTQGRIYRLSRGDLPLARSPELQQALAAQSAPTIPQLLELLKHPDQWWRDSALRRLRERIVTDTAEIRKSLREFLLTDADPHAWSAGLGLLQLLQGIDEKLLLRGLSHRTHGVRELAVRCAERPFQAQVLVIEQIARMAQDPDPRVRMQVALTLGDFDSPEVAPALVSVALYAKEDRWQRMAVLSSLAQREGVFLDKLLRRNPVPAPGSDLLFFDLGRLVGAGPPVEYAADWGQRMLAGWESPNLDHQVPLLTGWGQALKSRGAIPANSTLFDTVFDPRRVPAVPQLRARWERLIQTCLAAAIADDLPTPQRVRAIRFLTLTTAERSLAGLMTGLNSIQPDEVQTALIQTMASFNRREVAQALLAPERFNQFSPRMREDVLGALCTTPDLMQGVLDGIEAGNLPASAIDALRRRQFLQHKDQTLRERATKLLGAAPTGDRAKVYADHQAVLDLPSNSTNGKAVFKRTCANCHRLDREGVAVGPDLFSIRNQPKAAILLHILVPDQEITAGFAAYTVVTKDGRTLSGLISAETSNSLTLKQALGKEDTVLRQDIEELISSQQSLMPQGLEKTINHQEFADLLAYLKGEPPPTAP